MCEHCGARDFVRRANKVSDALIEAGRHQDAAVAFHTGDGIRISGHVPRKALEYLWDIEVELNIDEPRPEVWGEKETKMAKAKKSPLAPAGTSLKRIDPERACKGCIHEDDLADEQPCCECTEVDPKYDVGEQSPPSREFREYAGGTQEDEPGAVPPALSMSHRDFAHSVLGGHDPETGEVPSTDRDIAVPAIVVLVQRIVEENAPRALAAYLETKQPASFSVTCKLAADPVRPASLFIEVSGKLAVGVKGASGFVSIDDQQTRIAGT